MSILDFFGGDTSAEDAAAKRKLMEAEGIFADLQTPEFKQLSPELIDYAGDVETVNVDPFYTDAPDAIQMEYVDPRLADVALQDDTNMYGINVDPRLKDAQMGALDALGGIVESGGMTLADQANMNRLQSQVAQADKGRRDAILQNMQMRGQSGSGLELLAQLQSGQAATTDASQASMDIAGMAQDRALQAIMQGGQLGGQIRGQDFGEQSDVARAQDAINAFNAGNRTQGNQFNANTFNRGQEFNVGNSLQTQQQNIGNTMQNQQFNAGQGQSAATGNADRGVNVATGNRNARQGLAGTNVNITNEAQKFNRFDIPQQGFQNATTKAGGQAQGAQSMADYYGNLGDRKKQEAAEVFGAIVKGGTAVGSAYAGRGAK
jgi:predicted transcriptional regulator YdeE